jgi:hypothetical protein
MKKLCYAAVAGALVLSGCSALNGGSTTTATATAVSSTVTDAIVAVQDTMSIVQQITASGSLTAAQLATVTAASSKLQSDLMVLQNATGAAAAGKAASVLADITSVIQEMAPFVPALASLVAGLAQQPPMPAMVYAPAVLSVNLGNLPNDIAKLRADLAAGAAVASGAAH